jgi:2-oxoglutarate dehydrogenase E1 component
VRNPVGAPGSGPGDSDLATLLSGENGAYVEALFEDYLLGRASVPDNWRRLFDGLMGRTPGNGDGRLAAPTAAAVPAPPAAAPAPAVPLGMQTASGIGIFGLVNAYRTYGHLIANLDPLGRNDEAHPFLEPREFGLAEHHMGTRVTCANFLGLREGTPAELIEHLKATYCRTFAVEFMEMRNKERRDWLIEQMEPDLNRPALDAEERSRILHRVLAAERLEQFLHRRFLGQKRFSLEGAESLIPLLDTIVEDGAALGAEEMVIAMAHRGRLNVMAHTLAMPYRAIFSDFHVSLMPLDAQGAGDVKYHRGYSADIPLGSSRTVHLSLCPNPSHLEAINPVAEGIVRCKQNYRRDADRGQVVPIQIHGDAAFTGQGIVAETLALSELDTYWTGGTIHIIVNNQIGFTTDPVDYRFTKHPSDMAKVIQAPVFHVNDDPEACVHAARLAIEFRQRFKEDVIIDLVCYRRHGHNEGDDPTFTQPVLYRQIKTHPTLAAIYSKRLREEGVIDAGTLQELETVQAELLESEMEASRARVRLEGTEAYHGLWEGFSAGEGETETRATAIGREAIEQIGRALASVPEGFNLNPKLRRVLEQRAEATKPGGRVDWGTAEALAIGSVLLEGITVRMTGQDVERGTFSHRHAVLHDAETGEKYNTLGALAGERARFIIANSMLSEAAALGFEYGYSLVDPNRLCLWEAQFGDFANGAQVVIDQFISCSEKKWARSSGLVMLLPHGYEGQGPEHSSARLERFLQLCAEDNLQVCNFTTPAQYFHALRRQVKRNFRKPLIVMTPKSLLRAPSAQSPIEDLGSGELQLAIDDPRVASGAVDPKSMRRVLICSGKVYYVLREAQEDTDFDDVAIVRLEQIHPFPFDELRAILGGYATRDVVWVQEEPWNMGAWSFVKDRLERTLPQGARLRYVGRRESASPATGSYKIHSEEQAEFIAEAFARRPRARASS